MSKCIAIFMSLMIFSCGLEACVIYKPSDGTYSVDKSGSVNNGVKHKR
jgi:hypothetical protein